MIALALALAAQTAPVCAAGELRVKVDATPTLDAKIAGHGWKRADVKPDFAAMVQKSARTAVAARAVPRLELLGVKDADLILSGDDGIVVKEIGALKTAQVVAEIARASKVEIVQSAEPRPVIVPAGDIVASTPLLQPKVGVVLFLAPTAKARLAKATKGAHELVIDGHTVLSLHVDPAEAGPSLFAGAVGDKRAAQLSSAGRAADAVDIAIGNPTVTLVCSTLP